MSERVWEKGSCEVFLRFIQKAWLQTEQYRVRKYSVTSANGNL